MSNPQVELHITGYGVITLELDAEKAPKSTENFLAYVNKGHYNNTIFHRVIPSFMVQGGGFEPGMKQKPCAAPIENEANNGTDKTYTANDTSHINQDVEAVENVETSNDSTIQEVSTSIIFVQRSKNIIHFFLLYFT